MGTMGEEKMIGRSQRRREDERFLLGRGRFVDDIAAAGVLQGEVHAQDQR